MFVRGKSLIIGARSRRVFSTAFLVVCACVCGTLGASPAHAQADKPVYWICNDMNAGITYYSDVVQYPDKGDVYTTLVKAFQSFAVAKFGVPKFGTPVCIDYGPNGQAQARTALQQFASKGAKAVMTGWKGESVPATPAEAPARAASPASGTPYYCYSKYKFPGAARQTDYVTGAFLLTASYGWTRLWWSAYMHQTYHIPVDAKDFEVDCNQLPGAADKQQQVLSRNVTIWKERNEDVLQVNWKPTQTAPAGAAEPSLKEMLTGQVRPQDHAPIGAVPHPLQ